MSDFNVTKLENGDFEVTKNHQFKAKALFIVWILFILGIAVMSSCSTSKSKFRTTRFCKNQMY